MAEGLLYRYCNWHITDMRARAVRPTTRL